MKYSIALAATFLAVACYPSAKEVCEGSVETQCTIAHRCASLAGEAVYTQAKLWYASNIADCKTKFVGAQFANCAGQTGKVESAVCEGGVTGIDWGKIQDCRDELRAESNVSICTGTVPAACAAQTGYCTGGVPKTLVTRPPM